MKLTPYRLGDFCQMKYGKMPPKDVLSENGFPVFSGYRITGYAKEYLFDDPRVIVVARGVGGTGDVKMSPEKSWITNLSIVLDHDTRIVDKKFLLYRLGLEPLKEKLNTGAAQAQITIYSLKPYVLPLPDLTEQQRIASILSAYDGLIDNNRRRIQLLEQAARLLYKEWFVHLRFPGHEHVKIIDGVPEGWVKGTVADFGKCITGKTPSTKIPENFAGNILFVKTPDMHRSRIIIETEESLSDRGAATQHKKTLPVGTIIVACIGAKLGVVSITSRPCQTNQQINAVIPHEDYMRHYILFALIDIKPRLEAMGGGATMPNVNKTKFTSIPVLIPSQSLLKEFEVFVKTLFQQIELLEQQNSSLTNARDLLLPRLMNGEISV